MDEKKDKSKIKPSLVPTLGNLDSIEKSFEKARKEIEKKKNLSKRDFRSV